MTAGTKRSIWGVGECQPNYEDSRFLWLRRDEASTDADDLGTYSIAERDDVEKVASYLNDLEARLEKYEEALREIKALPSFPEVWDAERNMLTVSYPADAGPWHIARRALKDA